MSRLPARLLVLSLLLLLFALKGHAQDPVHHCVATNGTPVFTDQPCARMDARPVGAGPDNPRHACPATREALRQQVAAAFGTHDANALAGLMLWHGFTSTDAVREIAWFMKQMQRPLLDVSDSTLAPTAPVPAYDSSRPMPPLQAAMTVTLGGAGTKGQAPLRFTIAARAGCLWLLP